MKKMIIPAMLMMLLAGSCKKMKDNTNYDLPYNLGWQGDDDPSVIPQAIGTNTFNNSQALPPSVDLTSKFPPIGDQGRYGTCVAWATGYGIKTVIDGMEKGLTA